MSSENYRISNQNTTYFLTFTVTDWVDVFTRNDANLYALLKIEML